MAKTPTPATGTLEQVDPAWAWQPYEPGDDTPWNLERAAHLFRRAGFAGTWRELRQAQQDGCPATVERLMAGGPDATTFYDHARRTAETLAGTGNRRDLPAWWLYVMLTTPHPLLEKMTLLWHGHFATSAAKVEDPRLMLRQNELLRTHALGRFGPLLAAMAKDPAMLIWLDSTTNRRSHPNENFAREVMELFSLGLGNYTEDDIKQAARAFTGWELRHGKFRVNDYQHDPGVKRVLGQQGRWNGDDVIRILLEHSATGQFLSYKVFKYLVHDETEPPAALLEPLARGLREHDYDLAWLTRTVLCSNIFYSPHALRRKFKAPVEFALGLVHALEGTTNTIALVDHLEKLGQAVFYPPNVKGWDGGADWINSSTLLARANLAWALVGPRDGSFSGKIRLDQLDALAELSQPAEIARRLLDLLLAAPLPDAVVVQLTALAAQAGKRQTSESLARLVHAIATLPEFHLV